MGEDLTDMAENTVKSDGESFKSLKHDTQMTLYFLLICIVIGKLLFAQCGNFMNLDFSITQILCEINFGKSRSQKSSIIAHF